MFSQRINPFGSFAAQHVLGDFVAHNSYFVLAALRNWGFALIHSHSFPAVMFIKIHWVCINSCQFIRLFSTPADGVSLGLSGALFLWKKPSVVISG